MEMWIQILGTLRIGSFQLGVNPTHIRLQPCPKPHFLLKLPSSQLLRFVLQHSAPLPHPALHPCILHRYHRYHMHLLGIGICRMGCLMKLCRMTCWMPPQAMNIFQRHPWCHQWCHQWSMESIIQKHRFWATLHQWCQWARSFNHKVHLVLQGMRLEIASHAPSFTQRDAKVVCLRLRNIGFMYGHAMFCHLKDVQERCAMRDVEFDSLCSFHFCSEAVRLLSSLSSGWKR